MKVVLHIDDDNIFDIKNKILSALPKATYLIFNKDEKVIDIPAIKKTAQNLRYCASDGECENCDLLNLHSDVVCECSRKLKMEAANIIEDLLSEFITKE